jgi:hypothetical protein
LLQDERRGPRANGETIRLGDIVKMIGRNDAAGAGHVLDQSRRIAGNML